MKTATLFIAITLLFCQMALCQTVINGKIDNYTGKANDLLINPFFPEIVGKINAKGEFTATFNRSYIENLKKQIEELRKKGAANITRSTLKKFQTRYQCDDDAFSFTNGEQPYTQLLESIGFMVGDLKNKKIVGTINLVNSKDFGGSQVFHPQNAPVTGYMLDWYYVENPAKVHGSCAKKMSTGNGDETYNWEVKVDLDFHSGWNLVKYETNKIYTAKNGKKYSQTISYSSLDKMPEDVKYVYSKK